MLNHVQATGVQRDSEKMLQTSGKDLHRARTRGLQDCLRSLMQHQVNVMQNNMKEQNYHHTVTRSKIFIDDFAQPGMLRSYQDNSLLTLSAKNCLLRSVDLDVPLRKDRRSAMTR